jgi:hypothetical protein
MRVTGRVADFLSGAGVPGAAVRFGAATAVTDSAGSYTIALPGIGPYEATVDGVIVGSGHVTGPGYRGDFLVRPGACISRYGTIVSARTGRPVTDAKVSLTGVEVRSGSDGWYRVDLGCPAGGPTSFGTTIMFVTHPEYFDRAQVVGRGVSGVFRIDLQLHPR